MLHKINKIIITPGHGGGDSGAISYSKYEAINVAKICTYIQELADGNPIPGVKLETLDPKNSLGLQETINKLNKLYTSYSENTNDNVLAIEIHQDMNAPHLINQQQNTQMGIYYYQGDKQSLALADALAKKFISYGAYNVEDNSLDNFAGTWRRGHYLPWAGYYLGFIEKTNCWSLIIECGYISGRNSEEDLRQFAKWIYQGLWEIRTGQTFNNNINNKIMSQFHLQTEEQLTEWVKKHGVARIKESGGKDYFAIEKRLKELEKSIEDFLEIISKSNNKRREDIINATNANNLALIGFELTNAWSENEKKDQKIQEIEEKENEKKDTSPTSFVESKTAKFFGLALLTAFGGAFGAYQMNRDWKVVVATFISSLLVGLGYSQQSATKDIAKINNHN